MICAIVAVDQHLGIARDGNIPWRAPSDLTRFRAMTMGHPLIMGRLTWNSLKTKPLPGRENIVVSRQPAYLFPGAYVATGPEEALGFSKRLLQDGKVFVMGGRQIWDTLEREIDRWYVTKVPGEYSCDLTIPMYWAGWDCAHKHTDPITNLTYLTFNRN